MSAFHDSTDLKHLRDLRQSAPKEYAAWLALEQMVAREDGAIPRKYRELIALAVAHTTQCPYCIAGHVKGANTAGASKEEIAEAVFLAAALRAGAAVTHGAMTMKLLEEVKTAG